MWVLILVIILRGQQTLIGGNIVLKVTVHNPQKLKG